MSAVVEPAHKEAAHELRRVARQAGEAAGTFIRWSVYLETDPAAAIARMRKVLVTERTDTTSPFLPLIAESVLAQLEPAAVEACRGRREELARENKQRRANWDQEWRERDRQRQQEKAELKAPVAAARAKRIKDQTDNVVSVEFGGAP